ncbi:MAG: copper amine oxidase N-terminal domain-containing protein [Ruminococcaceae bacterium]|nr:copper amine oxidase N-terminal domain-containing protein [Oscillospiraceae bacterium]
MKKNVLKKNVLKKNIARLLSVMLLTSVLLSSFSVLAANDLKLQMFFAPGILNSQTGELNVDVTLKNYRTVIPDSLGKICSVTFTFDYSLSGFSVKKDENGSPLILLDDKTLIRSKSNVSVKETIPGRISVTFLDETLSDGLIEGDGVLCRFTLVSKSPLAFWNSVDFYPIRFVPGSLAVIMFDNEDGVNRFHNVEGIDNSIGAYNYYPTLVAPSVGKTVSFTVGEASVTVNGEKTGTDAAPFVLGETLMVPVRFLAENLNMEVFWDGETQSVAAFSQYKSLSLSVPTGSVYVNSAYYYFSPGPTQVGDRVYVPVGIMNRLYPDSTVTVAENVVTIVIP